jgi:hypothetical protein
MPVPALPPYLIEPIWQQFSALLTERKTNHPLGCHRSGRDRDTVVGPDKARRYRERMKRYLAALLVVLGVVGLVGVLAVGRGFANDESASGAKCSEATLHGTYLFAQNGVEIKGNGDQRPFAIAGYDVFDGNGEVKGVASGNFNGQTFRNEPLSGTYSVKANCTGTFTFTDGTRYDQFIAPDGSMFAFVRTNPEFVSAGFELRGTAKRVGE